MKLALLLPVVLFLAGCAPDQAAQEKAWHEHIEKTEQPCIARGGVPILSSWDNTLKDCIFPPNSQAFKVEVSSK